jgi:hypothetical protein
MYSTRCTTKYVSARVVPQHPDLVVEKERTLQPRHNLNSKLRSHPQSPRIPTLLRQTQRPGTMSDQDMNAAVKNFLASPRFAVAGASSDPSKFGHRGILLHASILHNPTNTLQSSLGTFSAHCPSPLSIHRDQVSPSRRKITIPCLRPQLCNSPRRRD